jgi:GAF domain-containing protein
MVIPAVSCDIPEPWAAIARVQTALQRQTPLYDLLTQLADEARCSADAITVVIALTEPGSRLLHFVAAAGEDADALRGLQVRLDETVAADPLRTGQALHLPATGGIEAQSFTPSQSPFSSSNDQRSQPVFIGPFGEGKRQVGVLLALGAQRQHEFMREAIGILQTFSNLAGLAVRLDERQRNAAESERELDVLYEAAAMVSNSLNVQQVMDSVLDSLCRRLPHQAALLFLFNDERTHLFIAAERGLTEEGREAQLTPASRLASELLEPPLARSMSDRTFLEELEQIPGIPSPRSLMGAPIRSREDTLGLILVASAAPDAYTKNDLRLMQAVAAQAGIAIQNAWLYEEAMRRTEETSALYDLSQRISGTLDPENVGKMVVDVVVNLLHVEQAALLRFDPASQQLHALGSKGIPSTAIQNYSPRAGQGLAGWVFEWLTPTAVADVGADSRNRSAPIESFGAVSALAVPLTVGDEATGVLMAMTSRRRLFTVAEMELLYTVANQVAVALENAELYQQTRAASTDLKKYFHRVSRRLGESLGSQDAPQLFSDLAAAMLRADRCAIWKVDGDTMTLRGSSGFSRAVPDKVVLVDGLSTQVIRRGRPLSTANLGDDPRSSNHAWLLRDRMTSYLGLPVRHDGVIVGLLELATVEDRQFDAAETRLTGQFIRRARLPEHLVRTLRNDETD